MKFAGLSKVLPVLILTRVGLSAPAPTSVVSQAHVISAHVRDHGAFDAVFLLFRDVIQLPLVYGSLSKPGSENERLYAGFSVGNAYLEPCGPYPGDAPFRPDQTTRFHGLTFGPATSLGEDTRELARRGIAHADDPPPPSTRPFRMGFTRWPSDLSAEGIQTAESFAYAHGDMVSVMFIGGIPWPEALEGKPFSKDVQSNLDYRPPSGSKLFLSISPLNKDRTDIAPYWGEKDNLPLPKPWDRRPLNNAEVKKAFLNFTLRAVKAMSPDYLAIGVESNVLLSHSPAKWQQLKELHRETYSAVKARYPDLPVFFTTEVLHYKKLATEAKDKDQEGEVADLMKQSDVFAMSIYPHMSYSVPRPIPSGMLDFARAFEKPIAVAESGMTSRDVELKAFKLTLRGSEADQRQFTELLLKSAARDRYEFVINFATTDFEKLCAKLPPPVDDLARIWAYTGMQTSEQKPKPALVIWDAWLKAKHDPTK